MNERDDQVQDYLDDRMTPEERAAFEDRLACDPALAAVVDDARALGDTLRALDAPLPDGFHERARERFEASVAPRRRFPWEALGLAAAALVLGAILVPWAMRTEFGESERVATERRKLQEEVRTAPAASEPADRPGEPKLERVAAGTVSERDELAEEQEVADFAPTPPAPSAPATEPPAKTAAAPPPDAKGKADRVDRLAGANEGFADAADDKDAGGRAERSLDAYRESAATATPRLQQAAAPPARTAPPAAAPGAAPLTVEHVRDAGATVTAAGRVPDADTWSRWVAAPGGGALASLAPEGDWISIIVIAGPADCNRVRVVPDPAEGAVVFVPAGPHDGCAIRLPDPAVPVRILREPPS